MFGYKQLYINGELHNAASGERKTVVCPANDKAIAEIAWAGREETLEALKSAQRAFPEWSRTPIETRVKYMMRLRDLIKENQNSLREAEMFEHGKTWEQTEEGFSGLISSLEFFAKEIQRIHGHVLIEPSGSHEHKVIYNSLGVVGAFIAWNFPMLNMAFKLGPAMAAGCPLVLRPSIETPITAYMVGELCFQAELPPGVVNILTGPVEETAEIITSSTIPAMLTLIGSTKTGLTIMKNGSTSVKRYSMELGGNAPALVFPDADIQNAADTVSTLKFANAGQGLCGT